MSGHRFCTSGALSDFNLLNLNINQIITNFHLTYVCEQKQAKLMTTDRPAFGIFGKLACINQIFPLLPQMCQSDELKQRY